MSSNHKYFMIPFESVPADPSYTAWFATWSRERPVVGPGMAPPMVVGVTSAETLPPGATLLAEGSKDPPPPPPPPSAAIVNEADFQRAVDQLLTGDRGEDE